MPVKKPKTIDDFHEMALCALDASTDAWLKLLKIPKNKPPPKDLLHDYNLYTSVACNFWKTYREMQTTEFLRSYRPSDVWIGSVKTGKWKSEKDDGKVFAKIMAHMPNLAEKWKKA